MDYTELYINSFINESSNKTDEQLLESIKSFSKAEYKKLTETVEKINTELSKDNFDKLTNALEKFLKNINDAIKSVKNRSKHTEVIEELKRLYNNAEDLYKKVKSSTLIAKALGIEPTVINEGPAGGTKNEL